MLLQMLNSSSFCSASMMQALLAAGADAVHFQLAAQQLLLGCPTKPCTTLPAMPSKLGLALQIRVC